MREVGPVRKRFSDDTDAASYTGIARTLLGQLKVRMQMLALQQLSRTVVREDGTTIYVASIFGQDVVDIAVPPAEETSTVEQQTLPESALEQLHYFTWGNVPLPCACRSVAILYTPPQTSFSFTQLGSRSDPFECTGNFGTRGGYQFSVDFLDLAGFVENGVGGGGIGPGDSCFSLTFTPVTSSPPYLAQRAAAAAAASGKTLTQVLLSDGTVLVAQPVFLAPDFSVTNNPITTSWSGAGYIELHDGSKIEFTVPSDVCRPPLPDTPPIGVNAANWTAARQTAVANERARRKVCSDALRANLAAGAIDPVHALIRNGHPVSKGTLMQNLMTSAVVKGSFGSGDSITNTRAVTLSYTAAVNGITHSTSDTIAGTQTVEIIRCADSAGNPDQVRYTKTTHTNWLPLEPPPTEFADTGDTGLAHDFTFQCDNADGLAQIKNGVVITGGASSILGTFDSHGQPFVPPYPQNSDASTYSYPQIYRDYRSQVKRLYNVARNGDSRWLDSAFGDKEHVSVIPFSVQHVDFGDLGMFPSADDIGSTNKLVLVANAMYTFAYNYADGTWSFVSQEVLQQSADDPSPLQRPYVAGLNCVFVSRSAAWPDVAGLLKLDGTYDIGTYRGQTIRLNAAKTPQPVPPLTPQEVLFQSLVGVVV